MSIRVEHLEQVTRSIDFCQRDFGDVIEWHLPIPGSQPHGILRSCSPVRVIQPAGSLVVVSCCRGARIGEIGMMVMKIRHSGDIGVETQLLERSTIEPAHK